MLGKLFVVFFLLFGLNNVDFVNPLSDGPLKKALQDAKVFRYGFCETCDGDTKVKDKTAQMVNCSLGLIPDTKNIIEVGDLAKEQKSTLDHCLNVTMVAASKVAKDNWAKSIVSAFKCYLPITFVKYDKCSTK